MARWPWLARELREILFQVGCDMLDGSYYRTSMYDDRNFPEPTAYDGAACGGGD
jgi:hypothetical protein